MSEKCEHGYSVDDLAAWLAHVGIRELEKYLARHAAFDAFLRERGLA